MTADTYTPVDDAYLLGALDADERPSRKRTGDEQPESCILGQTTLVATPAGATIASQPRPWVPRPAATHVALQSTNQATAPGPVPAYTVVALAAGGDRAAR